MLPVFIFMDMYIGGITIHGRSGTNYDFWLNTVEHLERLQQEGIYILTIKDQKGRHHFVHSNLCIGKTIAEDLLSEEVQKIIKEKRPTHISLKYGKANFTMIWNDVKIGA